MSDSLFSTTESVYNALFVARSTASASSTAPLGDSTSWTDSLASSEWATSLWSSLSSVPSIISAGTSPSVVAVPLAPDPGRGISLDPTHPQYRMLAATSETMTTTTNSLRICEPGSEEGWVFPLFEGERDLHAVIIVPLYLLWMLWLFMGIGIGSDVFMGSIEMITSMTKKVPIPGGVDEDGGQAYEDVEVWNETVATLTLMALGSSAPEILLSTVEMMQRNFFAGQVGVGTIIGSGSFNLFIIIAVCINAIPHGEVRKIKNIQTFYVCTFFMTFAYGWVWWCLNITSPGMIDLFEATLTLLWLPLLILVAYKTQKLYEDENEAIAEIWRRSGSTHSLDSIEAEGQLGGTLDGDSHSQLEPGSRLNSHNQDLPGQLHIVSGSGEFHTGVVPASDGSEIGKGGVQSSTLSTGSNTLKMSGPLKGLSVTQLTTSEDVTNRIIKYHTRHPHLSKTDLLRLMEQEVYREKRRTNRVHLRKLVHEGFGSIIVGNTGQLTITKESGGRKSEAAMLSAFQQAYNLPDPSTDPVDGASLGSKARALPLDPYGKRPQTTVQFASSNYTVIENMGYATVVIQRNGYLQDEVDVHYRTVDGTAVSNVTVSNMSASQQAQRQGDVPGKKIAAYEAQDSVVRFGAFVDEVELKITILDDDLPEDNEVFHVSFPEDNEVFHVSILGDILPEDNEVFRVELLKGVNLATETPGGPDEGMGGEVVLGKRKRCNVTIIDDDLPGYITFGELDEHETRRSKVMQQPLSINEKHQMNQTGPTRLASKSKVMPFNAGQHNFTGTGSQSSADPYADPSAPKFSYTIKTMITPVEACIPVKRVIGATGEISCDYHLVRGTALPDRDYEAKRGRIVFEKNQCESSISLNINGQTLLEGLYFDIRLDNPTGFKSFDPMSAAGANPVLQMSLRVYLVPGEEVSAYAAAVRDTVQEIREEIDQAADEPPASYWDLLEAAIYCNGSPEDQKTATLSDWAWHLLLLPWKLLFAVPVPAPGFLHGFGSFVMSLAMMGIVVGFVNDVTLMIGCALGVSDMLTAIILVAAGTSIPDTFASKMAAEREEHADESITNVTGSNSVNVFLGLGLPWFMAAVYWKIEGATDEWKARCCLHDASLLEKYPDGGLIMKGDDIGYPTAAFLLCACGATALLAWRRSAAGGELGGTHRYSSAIVMIFFWAVVITVTGVVTN